MCKLADDKDPNIPPEAFQPEADTIKYPNAKHWWCPDCDAHGPGQPDKYRRYNNGKDGINGGKRVNYCCMKCFEENIYILIE